LEIIGEAAGNLLENKKATKPK